MGIINPTPHLVNSKSWLCPGVKIDCYIEGMPEVPEHHGPDKSACETMFESTTLWTGSEPGGAAPIKAENGGNCGAVVWDMADPAVAFTKADVKETAKQLSDYCFANGPENWNVARCNNGNYKVYVSSSNGFFKKVDENGADTEIGTSFINLKKRTAAAAPAAVETGSRLSDVD